MSRAKMLAKKKLYQYAEKKNMMPAQDEQGEQDMPSYAHGGYTDGVNEDSDEDDQWGNYSPNVSSGEPHTNEYLEAEHPMEYMAKGGIVGVGENFPGPMSEEQEDPDMDPDLYAGMEEEDGIMGHLDNMETNDIPYQVMQDKNPQVMPNLAQGGKVPMMDKMNAMMSKAKMRGMKPSMKKMSAGGAVHHAFAHAIKKQGMR